jgi:hypothetical protein
MPGDKYQSLSELWSERYDDRDDEELAFHIWAQNLAQRDQAIAHPIKPFEMPEERPSANHSAETSKDAKPAV